MRNDAVLILSHWSDEAVKYMDLKKSIGHFCHVWSRAMMAYYYNYYHSLHKLPIQFLVQSLICTWKVSRKKSQTMQSSSTLRNDLPHAGIFKRILNISHSFSFYPIIVK